jgi:hypothetical protein
MGKKKTPAGHAEAFFTLFQGIGPAVPSMPKSHHCTKKTTAADESFCFRFMTS